MSSATNLPGQQKGNFALAARINLLISGVIIFFTCLPVGAVMATLVFPTSTPFSLNLGVRYIKHNEAQAATKSFPRAVPLATAVMGLCWTDSIIACCSRSNLAHNASRTNLFQSFDQYAIISLMSFFFSSFVTILI